MTLFALKTAAVNIVKKTLGIENLSLFVRKKKQNLEKLFFRKTYTANDIKAILFAQGVKPGSVILVHCAMNNFYNYRGSVDELLNALIDTIGPEGTLCMPAYPYEKDDSTVVFDVRNDKTAAGLLAETFRRKPGVKRSLNKLHSVCALGPQADYITSEHHLSQTCFDEKSPFYKIAQLGGKSVAFGLPYYYIGTIEHVPESLLCDKLKFYRNKFSEEVRFSYIDGEGRHCSQTMWTKSVTPYVRTHSTKLIDTYFDKEKYSRTRLSNIWITIFDAKYLVERLSTLALEGKTIYTHPRFSR